ncbi:MAG: cobyric acid synthase [Selenomonadaceae bacterium]|nr:cobyric acid synthase [Selenomonadaceae bacterium]
MNHCLMFMGTSSHVGKSILTTALCRIFYRQGLSVAPFKAQNMALNSFVTKDGGEMGRAQVAQAEAAGLLPEVDMNPVLLKPTGNAASQVIILGKALGNMSAREYHRGYSLKAFAAVKEALGRLQKKYDTLVIEGAGSPAEVNLKANDIVNMRVAKYLEAPVILVADIDRGGALAALVGTLELLDEEERALVKGLVINKFRGDVSLLQPAVDFLEAKTGKPVLGIVPYLPDLGIDDEDSVSLEEKSSAATVAAADLTIAVIRTPKIANFTDFACLAGEEDVSLVYVDSPTELQSCDLIILPGSKNTVEDLLFLEEKGLSAAIKAKVRDGVPLIGICGGYQMLGLEVADPHHSESRYDKVPGLGLLPIKTVFAAEKLTAQVVADCPGFNFLGSTIAAQSLPGYEIHMGETEFFGGTHPFILRRRHGAACHEPEGTVSAEYPVLGTYIHGIFDNDDFRRQFLNALRQAKHLPPLPQGRNLSAEKERNYDRLADAVRQSLDLDRIYGIMGF